MSVILIIVGCILKGRWGSYISSLVPRASVSVETGRDGKSSVDDWGCMHITSLHEGGEIGDRLHDVGHRVMYFTKTKKRLHTLFHQWQIKSSIQGSYWFMVSILVGLSKNSSRLFRSFKRFLNNTGFIFLTLVPFSKLNFISTHCYAKNAYVWEEYRNLISSTFLPKAKEIYLHCPYKPSILCTFIDQSPGSLFFKIKPSTKYIVCVRKWWWKEKR